MSKPQSFEAEVIELATTEDEFLDQIIAAVTLRFTLGIDVNKILDDIHDSAHVSLSQRGTSREEMDNDIADGLYGMEKDGRAS